MAVLRTDEEESSGVCGAESHGAPKQADLPRGHSDAKIKPLVIHCSKNNI